MSEHDDLAFCVVLAGIDGDERPALVPDFHPSTLSGEERQFYDALRWHETTRGDLIVEPLFLRGHPAHPGTEIGLMEIQGTAWGRVVLLKWLLRGVARGMVNAFRPLLEPIAGRLASWEKNGRT